MKYAKYFIIILTGIMILNGCSTSKNIAINKQKENEIMEVKQVEQTNEKKVINKLFANAENAWVGDIMAFSDEQNIYLNYLYETDHNGIAYHPIYRFSTNDLCTYYDDGEIIPFGLELESPDLAVGTGSFIKDKNGKYHCFYTGHNDKAHELGIKKECIMHAVSTDNVVWEKVPEDTFYAPASYSSDDFRDPFVLWNEDENCYWMLLGAKIENQEGSRIIKYISSDLSEWKLEDTFYEQSDLYYMECPDLFKINNWYYLIFSWNNVTYYRMSDNINGPWLTPEIDTFDGNAFYAAKTVEYKNKRYLFGFIDRKKNGNDEFGYTWAGSVCPYEIVQQEDGTLGVKMPSQYKDIHFTKTSELDITETSENVEIKDNSLSINANIESSYVDFNVLPQSMLLSCTIKVNKLTDDSKAGFLFGIEEDALKSYPVYMDFKDNKLCYDGYKENFDNESEIINWQQFNFVPGQEYKINLVVEDEIIILYMDDKRVLSNRIYSAVGKKWGIFAKGTDIEISDINVSVPPVKD